MLQVTVCGLSSVSLNKVGLNDKQVDDKVNMSKHGKPAPASGKHNACVQQSLNQTRDCMQGFCKNIIVCNKSLDFDHDIPGYLTVSSYTT